METVNVQINHQRAIHLGELASHLYNEIGEENDLSEEEVQEFFNIKSQMVIPDGSFITVFEVTLPDLELRDQTPQDIFVSYLNVLKGNGVQMVIKTNDSTLFDLASQYYQEIIKLEMDLRNVLTYILTYDNKPIDADVFKEFGIRQSQTPDNSHMDLNYENSLFYILFNHYASFSSPRPLKLERIAEFLQLPSTQTFEDFKERLHTRGISEDRHVDFLNSISTKLKPLEDMRNAIMHVRNLSKTLVENYQKATDSYGSDRGISDLLQEFWQQENEVLREQTWSALAKSQMEKIIVAVDFQDGEFIFRLTEDPYYYYGFDTSGYVGVETAKAELFSYLVEVVQIDNFDPSDAGVEEKIDALISDTLNKMIQEIDAET